MFAELYFVVVFIDGLKWINERTSTVERVVFPLSLLTTVCQCGTNGGFFFSIFLENPEEA